MKKIILCLAALLGTFGMTSSAEEVVALRGGVTALMHPGCNGYENWGHTIQAGTELQFTHWITPTFGVAVDGAIGWENGSKFGAFQTGHSINFVNVSAMAKVNLNNLFRGFRSAPDKFEFVAAFGPGWVHGFHTGATTNDISTKYQIEFNYNLNRHFQISIVPELNYNLTRTRVGNYPRFDARNSWYGIMAGVTYKFGREFKLCDKVYTQAEYDELMAKVNELRSREPRVEYVNIDRPVIVEKSATEWTVNFDYGKYDLDQDAIDTLNTILRGTEVVVLGEASTPGSKKFNQELSEKRALAVTKYLEERGVDVVDSKGLGATGHQVVKIQVK